MNKLILILIGLFLWGSASAASQALYVKKGTTYTKYNFGVAGDLMFFDNGHKLKVSGYKDIINLDNIDYISFNAPTSVEILTPYAQKQKMIEIGEAVYSLIDQKSVGDFLRMVDAFTNRHYHSNTGKRYYPPIDYDVPEEYWNVHNNTTETILALEQIGNFNINGVRTLRTKVVDLYKASDYFGVYVADQDKRQWVKTADADYLEIKFKGYDTTNYSIRLDCSSESSRWETEDFIGELPERMTMEFKVNSTVIARLIISSHLQQDKEILLDTEFTASEYNLFDTLAIINDGITDTLTFSVNGKESITSLIQIDGANLVNYEGLKADIKEMDHYHDDNGNCCGDDPEPLISHFYRAQSDLDILGMMQIHAKALNFSRFYTLVDEYEDTSSMPLNGYEIISRNNDNSVITIAAESDAKRARLEAVLEHLNNYADAHFSYDGQTEVQGYLTFEIEEENRESTYSSSYFDYYGEAFAIIDNRLHNVSRQNGNWVLQSNPESIVDNGQVVFPSKIRRVSYDGITPRLIFLDMTSYAFEDFFDSSIYMDFCNEYEEIIDTYETITGQKR